MGKLIAVVGNTAVGKTTLVQRLADAEICASGFEQHAERPFQRAFAADLPRYALANQVDYFLLRAEQEHAIRGQPGFGLVARRLDEDFYVFARHFWRKGYLSNAEYDLCVRLHTQIRRCAPPPDLFIFLTAPLAVIERRFQQRSRTLEIAQRADLAQLNELVTTWMAGERTTPILTVDASTDAYCAPDAITALLDAIARA